MFLDMKVAFFFGALNRGGAETLVSDVLAQWKSLPFDAVCIYRKEGNLSSVFHNSGAPMLRLPRKRSWFLYVFRLRRLLKQQHVDIIHAQTSLNAIVAVFCTLFTRIRVVTTFHGFGFVDSPRALRWLVFRGSNKVVFVSEYLRKGYLAKDSFGCDEKCAVVHNGIDFSKFGSIAPARENEGRVEMCMVGSFGEGRNHLFVCRFLNALKEKGVDFHFTFIGAARESEMDIYNDCVDYCRSNGLAEYVTFAGLRDDVPALLKEMDAFVYATRHDSFGIAVIEAIASGLPTFVNDWCVMQEITLDGKYATLYRTDDVESLCSKIDDFLSHRQEYRRHAQDNATAIRQLYSIEHHIASLADIYNSILINQ